MEKSRQSAKARERRLRAKYRRNIRTAIVLCLVIGLAGGFALGRLTAKTNESVPVVAQSVAPTLPSVTTDPTDAPTVEPTDEPAAAATADTTITLPTAEPTSQPTPEPEATVVTVPFGTSQAIPVEIYSDGTVRKESGSQAYETLNFTFRITRYLTTDYYKSTYGTSYNLSGVETGVEFELMLNDYTGAQTIDPNKVLTVSLENASGVSETGYKLVDSEIVTEKKTLTLATNVPATLYKRFAYDATVGEMKYLVVTTYIDGMRTQYKFELGEPVRPTATPAPTVYYPSLAKGETSDAVKTLQDRLIALGYLESGNNTGYYGDMTAQAVSKAQAAYGLAETGTADSAFQQKLFEEQ